MSTDWRLMLVAELRRRAHLSVVGSVAAAYLNAADMVERALQDAEIDPVSGPERSDDEAQR